MTSPTHRTGPRQAAGLFLRYAGPVLVVALGAVVARALILSREQPTKVQRGEGVLSVLVERVVERRHEPWLTAYGTVRAERTLVVRPTVGGPVISIHPSLVAGGRVNADDLLVKLDGRDFELAVQSAQAALDGAQADLDVELGSAEVAKSEWELLDRLVTGDAVQRTDAGRRLALREPYVARRSADVAAARTRLVQAKLDLERATIRAPFDALVLSEDVEVGTQISAGAEIARLVDRTRFLVEVNVPAGRLAQLEGEGAAARIVMSDGSLREARVVRWLGEVASAGRMARVHVAVSDPLGEASGEQAVLLGAYVGVELPMRPVERAIAVPREGVREGDVVWVVDGDERLELRTIEIGIRRPLDVLVTSGLETGDRVVLSPIAVALEGMRLDAREASSDPPAPALGEAVGAARDPEAVR